LLKFVIQEFKLKSYFGVMFHHFHGEKHPVQQGSLSADQLNFILEGLCSRFNLLNAHEFEARLADKKLQPKDICLTFDDALRCQFDIALPVLQKWGIKGFFFIYSSPFFGNPDKLEIFRYFRCTKFSSIDDFYAKFFEQAEKNFSTTISQLKKVYDEDQYLALFPFYSKNDKWFRFLRDEVLGKDNYEMLMTEMMDQIGFNSNEISNLLWMGLNEIANLRDLGHTIGLHSFSHPHSMAKLSEGEQKLEYHKNFDHLLNALDKRPTSMSHPSGSYSKATLRILGDLGVKVGFRSSYGNGNSRTDLEIPREDSTNIFEFFSASSNL